MIRALWGPGWTRLPSLGRRQKYCHNGAWASPQSPASACLGSTTAMVAPSGGPLKTAGLQGRCCRVRESVPFGGSNGLVCLFHGGHRYCHNGGMAFSRLYGGGLGRPRASRRPWGPRTPSRPPSRPARKAPGCRVKMLWSMGSAPFGGSDEIVIAAGPQLDPARRRARGARERALRPPHVPHRGAAPTCGVAWARVSPMDYAAAATP